MHAGVSLGQSFNQNTLATAIPASTGVAGAPKGGTLQQTKSKGVGLVNNPNSAVHFVNDENDKDALDTFMKN